MDYARVRPVSSAGDLYGIGEKHHVHLAGGVFAYEVSTSSQLSCAYYPQEAVSVTHTRRFDGRRLLAGLCAPLIVLFGGLILMFALGAFPEEGAFDDPEDGSIGIAPIIFVVSVGLSFVFTAVQVVRFLFRQRTTTLLVKTAVEEDEIPRPDGELEHAYYEAAVEYEFWHKPGKNIELDNAVEQLAKNETDDDASPAPVLVLEHDWSYTRPVRTALKLMFAVFLCAWFGARIAERGLESLGVEVDQPFVAIGLFALVPIAGAASYLRSAYRLLHSEPTHSTALAHFIKREYDLASRDAGRILQAQPDDLDALALAVHIRLRQGKLDEVAPYCRSIDELVPEAGSEIYIDVMKLWPVASETATPST